MNASKHLLFALVATSAALAVPRAAHAGSASILENYMAKWAAYAYEPDRWTDDILKEVAAGQCRADLKKNSAGVGPDEWMSSTKFEKARNSVKGENGVYKLKVADAAPICDDLDAALVIQQASHDVAAGISVAEWVPNAKVEDAGESKDLAAAPKACLTALAKVKPGTVISVGNGKTITPEQAKPICEKGVADAEAFQSKLDAYNAQKAEAAAAKYKAVGIKGKRLELFAYYDGMEWYLPGCEDSTADPKRLKKAKKLFQWLTDSSGVITIRKYTFKGDTYKTTEKTFYTEEKAYKGCR